MNITEAEMCNMCQSFKKKWWSLTSGMVGERSESKTHCVRQRNRIWDLQESEVNEALQKKKILGGKTAPSLFCLSEADIWKYFRWQPIIFADSFPAWKAAYGFPAWAGCGTEPSWLCGRLVMSRHWHIEAENKVAFSESFSKALWETWSPEMWGSSLSAQTYSLMCFLLS